MKVIATKTESKKDLEFPKLMISKHNNCVILATKIGSETEIEGTVLCLGESSYDLGWFSKTWNRAAFEDYTGEITLSND